MWSFLPPPPPNSAPPPPTPASPPPPNPSSPLLATPPPLPAKFSLKKSIIRTKITIGNYDFFGFKELFFLMNNSYKKVLRQNLKKNIYMLL